MSHKRKKYITAYILLGIVACIFVAALLFFIVDAHQLHKKGMLRLPPPRMKLEHELVPHPRTETPTVTSSVDIDVHGL